MIHNENSESVLEERLKLYVAVLARIRPSESCNSVILRSYDLTPELETLSMFQTKLYKYHTQNQFPRFRLISELHA